MQRVMKIGVALALIGGSEIACAQCPGVWQQLAAGSGPVPRVMHAMAYDAARDRVLLYGGGDIDAATPVAYGDLWAFDGAAWSELHPPGQTPGVRAGHAMAYDAARQRAVLFGGADLTPTRLADTWTWNGTAWTRASTSGPGARDLHCMAYDSTRQRVVLFGGKSSGNTFLGDTWEWNGAAWTSRATTGPTPRGESSMAFDPVRNRTILFGGRDAAGKTADTWEWDGDRWRQKADATAVPNPIARKLHALAWDPGRQRVVLFGGVDAVDTWAWDGDSWTLLNLPTPVTPPSPAGRIGPQMVTDSQRGRLVMFGGNTDLGQWFTDTWAWGTAVSVTITRQAGPPPPAPNAPPDAWPTATEGENVLLCVRATGTQPMLCSWRKDGVALVDSDRLFNTQTPALTVVGVTAADAGRYECVLTNACGSTLSAACTLAVRPGCAPDFNADGFVDFFDYQDFVDAFEGGC